MLRRLPAMHSIVSDNWRRPLQTSRDRSWRISKSVSHILYTYILQECIKNHCRTDNIHCYFFWQRVFTDFITVEMLFHAKVLEVYTHTYHNLEAMNTQKDLEVAYVADNAVNKMCDYCEDNPTLQLSPKQQTK